MKKAADWLLFLYILNQKDYPNTSLRRLTWKSTNF